MQKGVDVPGKACPELVVPMNRLTRLAGSGIGTSALFPFVTDAFGKARGEDCADAVKPRRAISREGSMLPSL